MQPFTAASFTSLLRGFLGQCASCDAAIAQFCHYVKLALKPGTQRQTGNIKLPHQRLKVIAFWGKLSSDRSDGSIVRMLSVIFIIHCISGLSVFIYHICSYHDDSKNTMYQSGQFIFVETHTGEVLILL